MDKSLMVLPALIMLGAAAAPSAEAGRTREALRPEVAKLAQAMQGYSAGKPVSCIQLRDVKSTEAIGDALIWRSHRNIFYRTDPRGGCDHSGLSQTFVTNTFGGRLCRGDVVRMVDLPSGFESGFCIMGDFTPYTRIAR